ncbi:thioredoxin family protein, partial [Rhizobium johnstonii]
PWCGPCKHLTPVFEKLINEAKGRVRLVNMNIDDHPSIAGQLGIQSIPAVIAFVNGRPADVFDKACRAKLCGGFAIKICAKPKTKAR